MRFHAGCARSTVRWASACTGRRPVALIADEFPAGDGRIALWSLPVANPSEDRDDDVDLLGDARLAAPPVSIGGGGAPAGCEVGSGVASGMLCACSGDGHVALYRVRQSAEKLELVETANRSVSSFDEIEGTRPVPFRASTFALERVGGCTRAAIASEDGSIVVASLGAADLAVDRRLQAGSGPVRDSAFLTANTLATCGGSAAEVRLWDIVSSSTAPTIRLGGVPSTALVRVATHAFRPDLIAAGSETGVLTVWDVRHPLRPLVSCNGHNGSSMTDLAFHPSDSATLFSSGSDGLLLAWDFMAGGESQNAFSNDPDNVAITEVAEANEFRAVPICSFDFNSVEQSLLFSTAAGVLAQVPLHNNPVAEEQQ